MAKRKTSILDDLQNFFVAVPWCVGPIVALVGCGFLRFLMPVVFQSALPAETSPISVTMNNTFDQILGPFPVKPAPLGEVIVLFVWLVSLVQKVNQRSLLNRPHEPEDMKVLTWREFELLVGENYRQRGFIVEKRDGASPDGDIDVVLRKRCRTVLFQCKHYSAIKVDIRPVRTLLGVLDHDWANGGILVAREQFSTFVNDFAEKNGIGLVDGKGLIGMVRLIKGEAVGI
ncbi:MAG TPA: restriction endonuclease [Candidatus Hydrogenedentes bacterium]|nr:restriction endonuclease [Candidatus Hydrogenedentota bacterium]